MMRFQLDDLHAVAMNAFNEMEHVAFTAGSDTTEFNERQFVFQLGAVLTRGAISQGAPLWTGFEYKYPGTRKRCDLVVYDWDRRQGGMIGWLEAKSTGLTEQGEWDNRFGSLTWREDFSKLGGISPNAWDCQHKRAWTWLYQFENYRHEVDAAFGTDNEWSAPQPPSATPNAFGTIQTGRVNLQRVLLEIESASCGILMSVCPRVLAYEPEKVFSALIVTAMVAHGCNPAHAEDA